MKIYQCSPSGEFLKEMDARPNPLEPGKYLIPAGCTTVTPPSLEEGQVAIFNSATKTWSAETNYRSRKFYKKENQEELEIYTWHFPNDKNMNDYTEIEPLEYQEGKDVVWDEAINNWKYINIEEE